MLCPFRSPQLHHALAKGSSRFVGICVRLSSRKTNSILKTGSKDWIFRVAKRYQWIEGVQNGSARQTFGRISRRRASGGAVLPAEYRRLDRILGRSRKIDRAAASW
jgi:hypothetical protein